MRKLLSSSVFRLIAIVLAVVIPLDLLTLALSRRAISQAERLTVREAEQALQLDLRRMDDALDWVDRALMQLSLDDADFRRISDKAIDSDDEYYRQVQCVVSLSRTLRDWMDGSLLLTGVFIYFPEKDWYVQSAQGLRSVEVRSFLTDAAASGAGADYAAGVPVRINGRSALVKMQRRRGAWCGSWIELRDLASAASAGEGHALALSDGEGTVLYPEDWSYGPLDAASERQRLDGTEYLLCRAASDASELRASELLPKREVTGALPAAIRLMQVLSIGALALLPLLMLAIQRWIIAPVGKLSEAMEHIEAGELDWRIENGLNGSEFERINRNFNDMMDQVKTLKISIYEEQLQAQIVKLGHLAQRVRPHFILNALNILYSYEPEEYALSRRMILCLSKYFRYVVNAGEDFVPLRAELEHIRNYFEIQQARFRRTFRAGVACEEGAEGCLVPPLLVQSFAENAIKHAFTPGEIIDISVTAQRTPEGRVCIRVSDTGSGISDEALERIEEFRRSRAFRRDLGVGIQNSIDRLGLLYAGEASLDIRRGEARGTVVEIAVPFLHREEAEDERDIG